MDGRGRIRGPRSIDVAAPSLDGRALVGGDEDSGAIVFHYEEAAGMVWVTYCGGVVRRGFLVGSRSASQLDYRTSTSMMRALPPAAAAKARSRRSPMAGYA